MKKTLFVVAAILTIGLAALSVSETEQAHDTWQPGPMLTKSVGYDIR